jgi:hypothetical protein
MRWLAQIGYWIFGILSIIFLIFVMLFLGPAETTGFGRENFWDFYKACGKAWLKVCGYFGGLLWFVKKT